MFLKQRKTNSLNNNLAGKATMPLVSPSVIDSSGQASLADGGVPACEMG